MISNVVEFCNINQGRILGLILIGLALFMILSALCYNVFKKDIFITSILMFLANLVSFIMKWLLYIWIVMIIVVLLSKILVF